MRTSAVDGQYVVFSIGDEEFALDISQVREIIKPPAVTRLPHAADFIEGVTNLRGQVIPIVDLRKRFGVEGQAPDPRVVVAEVDGEKVGLRVDSVTEVRRIPASDIEPPPESVAGIKTDFLKGVGKVEHRLVILLDINKLFATTEKIDLAAVREGLRNGEPQAV